LVDVEDQIQFARRYYNGTVRNYNICAESFPGNLVARSFGFGPREFFEIEYATERRVPDVKL
jgi:LemA protein